ncbi:aminopeptidase N [Streptomyces sp. MAR4 CNY-716]
MPGENLTREEARERARLLEIEAYEVELDLRTAVAPAAEPFRSVTTVRFRCTQPGAATFLDLVAPDVTAVTLNGRDLDPGAVFDGARIALEDLAAENEVVVDARCAFSRTGEGMHRFVDPEDGEVYLYTQYEPADARRVFATFEQPDLKAPFTFTVTAPGHWTVLSGAALAGSPERHTDASGTDSATWRFEPTKPISTYITAVLAGPYAYLQDRYTRTFDDGRELVVPLGALCRRSLARHFDADDIFTVTKQGLDFFHDHFDYPYPWGKYDQAFVPEYNIGAMENPGLVTFREEFVFRGKVTDAAYERRANVVLHEMAHMWFGDLVTMEWWDDLWLKESFADYMGALALAEATRFSGSWITFANRRKAWAYRADQLPTTHPITADIQDLEAAKLNFDGITYAKGAAVLKQLVAYVGRDAFMEGARRYFKRHAFRNTRLADLLAALEETSGRDMSAWSRSWLQTAGVDTLTPRATYDADGRITELAILREGPEAGPSAAAGAPPRPHRVAVGLYAQPGASGELVRYARAEADVTDGHAAVGELAGQPRPDLILVNDDDLTFCKARFDEDSLDTVRERLGDLSDPLARAIAWAAAWDLTRDGLMPARDYLGLVLRFAGRETDIGVLQGLHQQAHYTVDHYTAAGHRAEAEQALAEGALGELRLAPPGSDHQLAWARFFASVATTEEDLQLLSSLLDGQAKIDGLDVDQELRWDVLLPLVAHGVADTAAVEAELARDDTASGRRHQVRCLAARPDAAVKEAAWRAVVDSDELSNAIVEATISGFTRPGQRELLAPYAPRYFAEIERIWRERTIESAMAVVRGLYPALQAHQATLDATDTWLRGTEGSAPPALRRLVWEARDDLARALRAQERDAQD